MKKINVKVLTLLITSLALVTIFVTSGSAAGTVQKFAAWVGLPNIVYNNQPVTFTGGPQPLIINDVTYIPLRKMSELFSKNITWDQTTGNVIITDKPDQSIASLQTQIAIKDTQIAQLQEKVKKLEDDNSSSSSSTDIDDLEDGLNDDHDSYNSVDFEISLSGDEDDVTVRIDVDDSEWDDLDFNEQLIYLQDVCDDILDEYDDADIEGTVRDSSILMNFYTTSRGCVKTYEDDEISSPMKSFEDDLDDSYYNDLTGISASVKLEGEVDDDITVWIYIDFDKYSDEWEDLTRTKVQTFLDNIYDDVNEKFDDADSITCYAYNTAGETNVARYSGSSVTYYGSYDPE